MHKFLMKMARLYLARRVRRRPPRPLSGLNLGGVRRVLLISATALGDTIFSTPAIRALKDRYPAWELEVLAHRVFGVLLAHNPHVGRIYTYPGRNRRLLTLARDLKRRAYDLVIILHGNDPEATLLAYLSGSPYIIGSAGSPLAFAYSAIVSPAGPYEHAIERRLNYVRLLGADIELHDEHHASIHGPSQLHGAEVEMGDLRAGASLILAALAADGTSTIHGAHHVRRGYENIEGKFLDLGAQIEVVSEGAVVSN